MHQKTWILLADAAKARIYTVFKPKLFLGDTSEKDLTLIQEYNHPTSLKRDGDLVSDNSGRYRTSEYRSDTYDAPSDPKKNEEDHFALQLFKILHTACHSNQFEELILIASPAFMGMLNKHILRDDILQKSISLKIEKDYMKLNQKEFVKRLQEHL